MNHDDHNSIQYNIQQYPQKNIQQNIFEDKIYDSEDEEPFNAPILQSGPDGDALHENEPVRHKPGPVGYNPGPVGYERGPVGHNPGPVGHERVPVRHNTRPSRHKPGLFGYNPVPVSHNPIPVSHNPVPVSHERGPVGNERRPVSHEPGPVEHEREPVSHEREPVSEPEEHEKEEVEEEEAEEEEGSEVWRTRVISGRTFGTVPGTKIGDNYISRVILSQFRVHRPPQGGICGNKKDGAESIVLSGGYEDDVDDGESVVYTGAGGFDKGIQIANQTLLNCGNAALNTSISTGLPVRLIRGHTLPSAYAPATGYRYDGLYNVTDQWEEVRGEFSVLCFKLVRLKGQPPVPKRSKDIDYKLSKKRKLSFPKSLKKTKKKLKTEAPPHDDPDEEFIPKSNISMEPFISNHPKRKPSVKKRKSLSDEEDTPTFPKKSSLPKQSSTHTKKIVFGEDINEGGFKLDHSIQDGLRKNGKQNGFHLELSRQGGPTNNSILSGTLIKSSGTPLMAKQEQNNEPIPFLSLQDEFKEDPKEQFSFSLDIPEVEHPTTLDIPEVEHPTTPQQPTVDFSTLTEDFEILIDPEPEKNLEVEFLLWGNTESYVSENNDEVDGVPIEQLSETHNYLDNYFTLGNETETLSNEFSLPPSQYHITEQPLINEQITRATKLKMKKRTNSTENSIIEETEEMTEVVTSPTRKENVTKKKTRKSITEATTDIPPDTIGVEVEEATTETITKPFSPNNRVLSPSRDKITENGETPLSLEKIARKKFMSENNPTQSQKTPRPPTLPNAQIHNNRNTTKKIPPKKIKVYKRLVPKRTYGNDKEPLKDMLSEMPSLRKTTKSKPLKGKNNESGDLWFSKPKESNSSLSANIQLSNIQ